VLWIPYALNIAILVPIASLTLLGGARGGQLASQGTFPESAGFRTLVGSLWGSILIGSCLGLRFPVAMAPLLLLQLIYKSLWLLVYAAPRVVNKRTAEVPAGIALTFLLIIATYPWFIPWRELFTR
jgi:uncharacterized membrane protein (UPF0136 family)